MTDLRARRLELGLNMADVAKMVKVSEATISRWETGGIKNLKRDKIYRLAKALQLNPLELVFDSEPDGTQISVDKLGTLYPEETEEFTEIFENATDTERAQIMAILRTFKK